MMYNLRSKWMVAFVSVLLIALGGCNMPGQGGGLDDAALATAARLTVDAHLTQAVEETMIAGGAADTPTPPPAGGVTDTPAPPPAGAEVTPTATLPPPTQPPTATNTPIPCNWASFVADVTYPDGTDVLAGSAFTKTWRLKNIGSCSWTSGYRLIFSHGDRMSAPDSVQLTSGVVNPGETVDVSVDLVAPSAPGTYQGDFLLRSSDNVVFGIGANADKSFWVKVDVFPPPTDTPTATPTDTPAPAAQPDLVINLIELNPATPTKGNPVDVKVQVYNDGNALAAGPFVVEWYPGEYYSSPACSWTVSSLVAHGGLVLTCTYAGYPSWYGSINTKAVADATNAVAESDEGNNAMLMNISVNP